MVMKRSSVCMTIASVLLASAGAAPAEPNIYLRGFIYIDDEVNEERKVEPNGPAGNPNPNSFAFSIRSVSAAAAADYTSIQLANQQSSRNTGNFEADSGETRGFSSEQITINAPGLEGTFGRVIYEYGIAGSMSASGAIDPEIESFVEYTYGVTVHSTSQPNAAATGRHRIFPDGSTDTRPAYVLDGDILNQKRQLKPRFKFGEPFPITWDVTTLVRSSQRRPNVFSINLETSGRIVGIEDDQGNVITDFTITSESGTEYGPRKLWVAGRDLAANEKPDRSGDANPVNATVPEWSYGYRSTAAGTALTLFTPAQHFNNARQPNMDGWDSGGDAGVTLLVNAGTTDVVYNFGSGNLRPILPGQIYFDPSNTGTLPVLRWTAPAAGRYNIVARWLDLDTNGGNGVSCHTVIDGVERFSENINNGGSVDMPLLSVDLQAGAVVDFAVGSRGDFSFDSTGLNAAISLAPAVELALSSSGGSAQTKSARADGAQVPSAATTATVTEASDVTFNANIKFNNAVRTVELRDNGKVVGRDNEAPYQFTIENIESGTHSLRAVAIDGRGVEGVSDGIELNVVQNGAPARAMARSATEPDSTAPAQSGTSYFFTELFGDWDNPFSWTPVGVPGPNDDAFITGPGDGRGSVVTLKGKFDVGTLSVGSGSQIVADAGSARFERGLTGLRGVWLNDCELRGFELVVGQGAELSSQFSPRFFNMAVVNNGDITYHNTGKTVADSFSELRNNGTVTLQRNPASNTPVEVNIPQIQQNGGLLHVQHGSKLVFGGLISEGGSALIGDAGSGLISDNGSGLISENGGALITDNGAGLISDDGSTLIGSDGGSVKGPNGAPLIGSDGATLVGNAGNTLQGPPRRAAQTGMGSTAEAASVQGIVLGPGAVLSGRGNIVGNLANEAGFVAPGSSADVIRILGNYTQGEQGTLLLEVGGTTANPPQFDQLQIRGAAALGGNLIVRTINGFTPQSGDTFAPLTYNSASGSFASITANAQVSFGSSGMTMQVAGPNPPAPKALNIATRMRVETGDNVLIAGFIVTGSQPKKVLVRGIGPTLPVEGALGDPTLDLDAGAFFNDDWRSDQQGEIEGTSIPPASDLESAIVATLEPGAHTAVLRGKNDGTGVGLVEVYDLESGSPVQLANISTRGQVQTGDNVMIGGFIIAGDYPAKVLIRAIGPSLPVEGALQDPTLELVDSNGATISNDNWRATQEAEIIGTTVPPTSDRESAIVATLVPGAYTAVVRGKDDTTGVALVEGYNLP